jgi:hypothetical protein
LGPIFDRDVKLEVTLLALIQVVVRLDYWAVNTFAYWPILTILVLLTAIGSGVRIFHDRRDGVGASGYSSQVF